jgi:PPOX class probable F420-dependent enzyme
MHLASVSNEYGEPGRTDLLEPAICDRYTKLVNSLETYIPTRNISMIERNRERALTKKNIGLDEKARKLFEGKNFAFVATVNRDGSPHVTPVWVDTDGKYILVNTAMGRVKQTNTKRDPRVAVAIFDQTNPYHMVTIQGRVVDQLKGNAAEQHIDKMAKKYTGQERYPNRQPGEQRVLLKIEPERIASM